MKQFSPEKSRLNRDHGASNETIKVSVIIITRNRAKLLAGCLESLIKQTRMPDEVIVVDTPTDNTKEVVLSFKENLPIKYVIEKQIGIPYARNKGLQAAHGELVLMLDDDCEADKHWVENMIKAHKKYPKAWVVQGRTYSLPPAKIYSILAEFNNFIFVLNYAKKSLSVNPAPTTTGLAPRSKALWYGVKNFFRKYFKDDIELLTCETKNFSAKTSYLKKHNLSFDENFYRAEDIDFGKQIIQKNGSIIFCPRAILGHWERPSLVQFLIQRWHVGRTVARISNKWRAPLLSTKIILGPKMLLAFLVFCKAFDRLHNLPMLMAFLLLDRICYLNGWFYEKMILSLQRNNEAIKQ